MESDGLETDEIVSGRNCRGDGRRPGRVLSNHLAVSPRAAINGTREQPGFVNLELVNDENISNQYWLGNARNRERLPI